MASRSSVLGTGAIQATAISFCLLLRLSTTPSTNQDSTFLFVMLVKRQTGRTIIVVADATRANSLFGDVATPGTANSRQKLIAVAWVALVPSTEDRLAMNI
jgi:hypothetical protein